MTQLLNFPPYLIALILSLLVGFLVVALVVNSQFRKDILANEGENEAQLFGSITVSGGRFFLIIAIFLILIGGIFYLYPLNDKIEFSSDSENWIPFDTQSLTPTTISFRTKNDTITKSSDMKSFDKKLKLDANFNITNQNADKPFNLGNIEKTDIKALGFYNKMEWAHEDEFVKFKIDLKPFKTQIKEKSGNYRNLPFQIEVYKDTGIFYKIFKGEKTFFEGGSLDKGSRKPFLFETKKNGIDKLYFVKNTSSRIDTTNKAHAYFEIITFNKE